MIKNWFKKLFRVKKMQPVVTDTEPLIKTKRVKKPKVVPPPIELSDKEKATAADQPYISILKVEIDPKNINNGSFELDWNDKFLLNLIRAGYKIREDDTDQQIVDRWFQTVCRNIALEIYEQDQADPDNREGMHMVRVIGSKDLGNGRTEVS